MKFTKIFLFALLGFFALNIASVNATGVTGEVTVTVLKTQEALTVTSQTVTYPNTFSPLQTIGGSGEGTVSFSIVNGGEASGCTISGTSLTYGSSGTCKVTATKLGDAEYNSITSDTATFTINPAPKTDPTCSVSNSPQTYTGSAIAAIITCNPTGGSVTNVRYNGTYFENGPTTAGTYSVTLDYLPTISDQTNYNSLTGASAGNFVISPAKINPTCSVNNTSITYTGSQVPVVISSVPTTTNPTDVRYNGSSTVPTAVGSYTITAVLNPTDTSYNSPYTATCTGGFAITSSSLTSISISGVAQVGQTFTSSLLPAGATASYRWEYSATPGGSPTIISGATSSTYTIPADPNIVGKYIKVVAIGTGSYLGSTVTSNVLGPAPFIVSVTPNPTRYITTPNTNINFTYTPTTNAGNVQCLLLDYQLEPLTDPTTSYANPVQDINNNYYISRISPNGYSMFRYYIRCRNTTDQTVTATSSTIDVYTTYHPDEVCVNGALDYPTCTPPVSLPDLTVSNIIPTKIPPSTKKDFFAIVTNIGTADINDTFSYSFEFASDLNGNNILSSYAGSTSTGLNKDSSITITLPKQNFLDVLFFRNGTYYMQACADIYGTVDELKSNGTGEDNNCTSWTKLIVDYSTFADPLLYEVDPNKNVNLAYTTEVPDPWCRVLDYNDDPAYWTDAYSPGSQIGGSIPIVSPSSPGDYAYYVQCAMELNVYANAVSEQIIVRVSDVVPPTTVVSVTASPLNYDAERRSTVSFTYTSSTNSGAGTSCKLVDYNENDTLGTTTVTGNTNILYTAPSTAGDFGYRIKCWDKVTTSVTATSELIHVKIKPIIRFGVFDLDNKGTIKKLINGSLVDVTDSFENDEDHVNYGSNQTYLFSPNNSPYMILYIDTILVPLSNPSDPYTQIFNNITSDHEVSIKFIPNYPYCDVDPQNCYYGSLSSSPNPCMIASGESSCTTSLTLNITNPVSGAETNITKAGNIEVASGITPAEKTGIVVPYDGTTFYLNHNAKTLTEEIVGAICTNGTDWNGTVCAPTIYGCNVPTDTNYDADGPDNNWNCAGTCANGYTNYLECTIPPPSCPLPLTQNVTVACDLNASGDTATSGNVTRSQTKTAYPSCAFGDPVTTDNSTYVSDTCVYPPSSCTLPLTQNVTVACDLNANGDTATSGNVIRSQTKTAYPSCAFETPVTTDNSTYVSDSCIYPVTPPEPPADPTGELIATGCTIQAGESSCNTKLTWETFSPKIGITSVIKTPDINGTQITTGNINTTGISYAIPYGTKTFVLVHDEVVLDSATATAAEAGDCEWDGATCVEKDPNIKFFNATPNPIFEGKSSKLSWEAEFVDSCSIKAEDTSGAVTVPGFEPIGTYIVKPTETTKYTLSCSKINETPATSEQTIKIVTINIKEN